VDTNAGSAKWPPLFVGSAVTNDIGVNTSKNIITGFATYYAKQFEGELTATGEVFRHNKLTAASNSFALNTWVRVTNILTGRSIIVRINDRMHPRMSQKGRVVDLTYTGAKQLQIITRGVVKVKVEPISADVADN
jgi:rare lipoprotein A